MPMNEIATVEELIAKIDLNLNELVIAMLKLKRKLQDVTVKTDNPNLD